MTVSTPIEHRNTSLERSALDVATDYDAILVDVRPLSERCGELGWLPASLHLPTTELHDAADEALNWSNLFAQNTTVPS